MRHHTHRRLHQQLNLLDANMGQLSRHVQGAQELSDDALNLGNVNHLLYVLPPNLGPDIR